MIFLANRTNLGRRTLLTRLHNTLQTRVENESSPIERVWYHTSAGNKVGVRARVDAPRFLGRSHAAAQAELHATFDFPPSLEYDCYTIQWIEPDRRLMVGWHQDETHMAYGECHFQVDVGGDTVQRHPASFLDTHPLNVFDARVDQLGTILDALTWDDETPTVPERAIE